MIVFLDIDGVLHPDPCYDRDLLLSCLPRFESVIREFPGVEIVISSTWREKRSLTELSDLFSPDIAQRIIGVTPSWKDHQGIFNRIGYQRHSEVEAWMRASSEPWRRWVAIDDKPYLFRPFLSNLVKTKSEIGFDDLSEITLRDKLSEAD